METTELIDILKSEKPFFESLPDIQEVVLYGSALTEDEITDDIDLLVIPSQEMSESEKVDLRQKVWEQLRGKVTVALDVQAPKADLDKDALTARGVEMTSIYSK